MLIGDMKTLMDESIELQAREIVMKWDVGKLQPRTVEIQASNDGETWAYVTEWVDLSGFRLHMTEPNEDRAKRKAIAASPIGALCGPHDGYAPAVMKSNNGQYRCLGCHATLTGEAGPSAVATAPAREPWVPSVCEWDLLPDAGR
jgi:hypothetical protein